MANSKYNQQMKEKLQFFSFQKPSVNTFFIYTIDIDIFDKQSRSIKIATITFSKVVLALPPRRMRFRKLYEIGGAYLATILHKKKKC
jgi:hypothetical protein